MVPIPFELSFIFKKAAVTNYDWPVRKLVHKDNVLYNTYLKSYVNMTDV